MENRIGYQCNSCKKTVLPFRIRQYLHQSPCQYASLVMMQLNIVINPYVMFTPSQGRCTLTLTVRVVSRHVAPGSVFFQT